MIENESGSANVVTSLPRGRVRRVAATPMPTIDAVQSLRGARASQSEKPRKRSGAIAIRLRSAIRPTSLEAKTPTSSTNHTVTEKETAR